MSYAIGIDCGNTAIKAALFDENGHEIATVANNYPTHIPCPDYTEADMNECWQICANVIANLIEKTGIDSQHVVAIGTSGHGNGLYLLNHDKSPLLAIKSLDNRAEKVVQQLQYSARFQEIKTRNRQGAWSSQTATLLLWLKQHQPSVYQKIGQVLFCKDFVNFCLTGECATEWGDITASGLFDFERDMISEELLNCYDLADIRAKLPSIYESHQVIGSVTDSVASLTKLKAGTPVIAGLFDVVACAYGSEASQLGATSVVAGTWNINQVVTDSLPPKSIFMACKFSKDRYLAIESSTCSASNLEWLVERFFSDKRAREAESGTTIFEQFNRQLEDVELTHSLPIFHPYLYGSTHQDNSSANLFGLKGWHQDIHIVYAFYEGIVFAHLEHIERLRENGYQVDCIAISGGASRSQYWCQLFADVLGVTVIPGGCDEVGAKGVAMLAFASVRSIDKRDKRAQAGQVTQRRFEPNHKRGEFFAARYRKYGLLRDALTLLS
ncbi:FGGY-family carbohydrate kinase [Vibrio methylphosphonaticus]|uniref:FGGY-family carbohydrate kinase n=1 Tax=Vibrio methylphosphonaticus TaxID=2946866 RepID=UPI00202A9151|nr:FGGY-family carbohydrate kinase [Vibrio methylphosphonaticus]MCL9775924.1 carbohydrate kinase [Vibrio methylphosphonaticus]